MISSLTGFGKITKQIGAKKISIEVKSLNSKSIDVNVKLSSCLKEKELDIRKLVAKELKRGKIELLIYSESIGKQTNYTLNKQLIKEHLRELKKITNSSSKDEFLLQSVLRLPDVLSFNKTLLKKNEWIAIKKLIKQALKQVCEFRIKEGKILEKDFVKRVKIILKILNKIKKLEKERINLVINRIKNSFKKDQIEINKNRFEQELIFYLEKLDITEEFVRLENQCIFFQDTLKESNPNGKKLGFILQEMGREIKTIGSKANYSKIQKLVVEMKDELEKIKEQILNVL